jgi:hypothetical protein
LALFRRAGLFWVQAYNPALKAALLVANEKEEDEWLTAIEATKTAWLRAYERRDTGSPFEHAPV